MIRDSVTVSTIVAALPDEAFTIFTTEVDAWWRRSDRHRHAPAASVLRFVDDHLVEVSQDGATRLGRVVAWEPGRRLALEWLDAWRPDWVGTSVDIRFEQAGTGTRVTLVHRGWTEVRPGDARSSVIGLWWGDLLAGYAYRLGRLGRTSRRQ
jgi:uncharacterized protein YndB with AHSA1/START domain